MNFNPTQEVKALTWKQPFASLMLQGKIETRKRPASYRGLVLICAAKVDYRLDQLYEICSSEQVLTICDKLPEKFYNGHAIALGRLVDCRPMRKADEEKAFVKYYTDLYAHVYEDVVPIEPFPYIGTQGWSNVTLEQKKQIRILEPVEL